MTAPMNYVQDVFRKLSVDSNPPILIIRKQEQEEAVNSLINRKNVYAVVPTGFEFYFSTVLYGCEADEIVWPAHRSWKLLFISNRTANFCCFTTCSNSLNLIM